VECQVGVLTIHLQVRDATRSVRLTLSNGHEVTSPVMLVSRALGGPAALYYQAVPGPAPIPVAATELDGRGRSMGTVATPRVVECTNPLVHYLPGGMRVLAKVRAPDHRTLVISTEEYRFLGKQGFGLKIAFQGRGARVIGFGALRSAPPLEWQIKRICTPYRYSVVYGVLASKRDVVLVRTGREFETLHHAPLRVPVRRDSVLVYGFTTQDPRELIVRAPTGATVLDDNVAASAAEAPCA
jgi:hypothetical protein